MKGLMKSCSQQSHDLTASIGATYVMPCMHFGAERASERGVRRAGSPQPGYNQRLCTFRPRMIINRVVRYY